MEIAPFLLVELLLWLACLLLALRFLRFVRAGREQGKVAATVAPSVTLVIVTQDDEASLREVLPRFLEQQYAGEYMVVVADIRSKDDTLAYLEDMEERYPQLSHTTVPASARDISLQRLAMTLGQRSACTEWVVFTQPGCCPSGPTWLTAFMAQAGSGKDAVLGLTVYAPWHGWTECKQQFFRLWQQSLWLPFAQTHAPYRAEESLLAYRTDHFRQHGGFGVDANLISGAATLLVNKNIAPGRCAASLNRDSILVQNLPPHRKWQEDRSFFMETRQHTAQGFLYRLRYAVCALTPLLFTMLTLALILWHIPNFYVAGALALMWVIVLMVRAIAFSRLSRYVGIRGFGLAHPLLEMLIPLWDLSAWLRWRFTNKRTYRKKFV